MCHLSNIIEFSGENVTNNPQNVGNVYLIKALKWSFAPSISFNVEYLLGYVRLQINVIVYEQLILLSNFLM